MIEHLAAVLLMGLYIVAIVYAVSWRMGGNGSPRD